MKWNVCLLIFFTAVTGFANDDWVGTVGVEADWNVGANWSSGVVPDAEIAFVDNGGFAVMSSGTVFSNGTVAISQNGLPSTVKIEQGVTVVDTKMLVGDQNGWGTLLINGGSIDTSTRDFVLAQNYISSTGVVVMTGGEVTAKNFYVGLNGSGFFTLSNGLFRTTSLGYVGSSLLGEFVQEGGTNSYDGSADLYLARFGSSRGEYTLNGGTLLCSDFLYLGYAAQAEGFLTINGGTLINSNNVVIGASTGGKGSMMVNGGNGNWQHLGSILRVGYGTGSTGTLAMNGHTNSFNSINVGDQSGSTGCVTMTECDITVSNGVALAGASSSLVQNGGDLAITSGGLSIAGAGVGAFTASNNASLSVDNLIVSGSLEASDNTVIEAGYVFVGMAGTAELRDSKLTVTNASVSANLSIAYGGQVSVNGGSMILDNLALSAGDTKNDPPAFLMTEGEFTCNKRITLNGGMSFVQTGGVISNLECYAYGSSNNVARFEISGGKFVVTPLNYAIFNSGTSEFYLKGSAPQFFCPQFSYVGGQVKPFLLAFTLDKSPAHLAPVNFTGTGGYRCGHLRVELDGGAVLLRKKSFPLLNGVKSTQFNYLSKPDTDMWTESLADQTSRVTLAGGYQTGTLSMGGTVASGSFAAMSMGHVEVSNINTNRLIELNVRMAVQEGAKTVDEVVADFVAAGYTNSVVEAEGDYNVKLVIPAEDVADQSEAPVSYFAWDFTQTLSITNVESVVTNATVTAVKLEYTKLPTQGTMILVL